MAKNSKEIPLVGQFYEDRSKNLNAQRTVNMYPTASAEGKKNVALVSRPAIVPLYDQGGGGSDKVLGPFLIDDANIYSPLVHIDGDNYHYCVALNGARQVETFHDPLAADTPISSTQSIYPAGMTQDDSYVYMVVPTKLNYLWRVEKANIANIGTTASLYSNIGIIMSTGTIINPTDVAYMDEYVIVNHMATGAPGDTQRGYFWANMLNKNLTITTAFTGTDFARMYYTEDNVRRIITAHGYLYLFGDTHYEVWYNAGTETFPFEPIKEATREVGLYQHNAICKLEDYIGFIGVSGGSKGIYLLKGLELEKVSTPAIDIFLEKNLLKIVRSKADLSYLSTDNCGAWAEIVDGHKFLNFRVYNSGSTPEQTIFVYDIDTKLWHEKKYLNSTGNEIVSLYHGGMRNDSVLLTTHDSNIYTYDFSGYQDKIGNTTPLVRYRTTQHLAGDDAYAFHHRVRLDIESVGAANTNANIWLSSTDDDGKTWYNFPIKSFANTNIGSISGDKRIEWFRLGRSDDRIYKFWTNANAPVTFVGAWADIEGGYR